MVFAKLNREWLQSNAKKRKEYKVEYRKQNRDSINAYRRRRRSVEMQSPVNRLRESLRSRFRKKVKSGSVGRYVDFIGCTIGQLKSHLESQFKEGMNWGNYGRWHIDHIIPVCAFDLTDHKAVSRCFHYTNLQPLWAVDNLLKGANLVLGYRSIPSLN
jgi:hypothetical protein